MSLGRYHTAIGYYNTAYHHGTWFQTATGRPFIFAFEDEGGILPIHNVGISADGRIPSGRFGLSYIAEIGNGRASRTPLDPGVQNIIDENNGKAVNLALISHPEFVPGLQAGFSVYRDRLNPDGLPKIGETIIAGHLVYKNRRWELLNEALTIRHAPTGSTAPFHTFGFYTQVARRFGRYQPYFRYQYLNAPAGDPILGEVGQKRGPSGGLRLDFSKFAAFKAQYDRTAKRSAKSVDGLTLKVAFTF